MKMTNVSVQQTGIMWTLATTPSMILRFMLVPKMASKALTGPLKIRPPSPRFRISHPWMMMILHIFCHYYHWQMMMILLLLWTGAFSCLPQQQTIRPPCSRSQRRWWQFARLWFVFFFFGFHNWLSILVIVVVVLVVLVIIITAAAAALTTTQHGSLSIAAMKPSESNARKFLLCSAHTYCKIINYHYQTPLSFLLFAFLPAHWLIDCHHEP